MFHQKEPGVLEEMADSRSWTGNLYKMSLCHFVIPDIRGLLKTSRIILEKFRNQLQKNPEVQIWDNLNIEKKNNGNRLKPC